MEVSGLAETSIATYQTKRRHTADPCNAGRALSSLSRTLQLMTFRQTVSRHVLILIIVSE